MAQRTAFLNSDAKWFNKDFHHTWINNYMIKQPWVMFSNYSTKPEFALGNWQISWGKAIIRCTRTTGTFAGEEILACFESTSTENISTAWNKKVYIEIPEVYVNDSTAITDSLTQWANLNVWRIVSSDSYPTHSNYIKLWEISNGDWQNATDLRPEVLRRWKPNTLSYFGGNGEEERIDIDNASLNKYLMSNWAWVAPTWEEWGGWGWGWSGENFKRAFTADENLLAKSMFWIEIEPWVADVDTLFNFWTTTSTKVFLPVIINWESFNTLTLNLAAESSPADALSVRIETLDNNWMPTWTLVDVWAYWTVSPTDTATNITVTLSGTVEWLTAHTKAAVVLDRSGSSSDSNYYKLWCLNWNKVISLLYSYDGVDYSATTVSGCVDCDWFASEAVVQATDLNWVDWVWYCESWALAWNDFVWILQGTVDYSWAVAWAKYYLSSTWILTTTWDIQVGRWLEKWVLQIWNSIWWWGWQTIYEAIVAADGSGDYINITDAILADKKTIYVKNWAYTMSQLTLSTWDFCLIWESKQWVQIDVSFPTRNWAIFTMTSNTTDKSHSFNISNVTFNITYTWAWWYFRLFEIPAEWFLTINDCNICVVSAVNWCNFYLCDSSWHIEMNWCHIEVFPTTWEPQWVWFSWMNDYSVCRNSSIIVDASASIGTSWLVFWWNPSWVYIWCEFSVWKTHNTTWDIIEIWASVWIMCKWTTSTKSNIRIYGTSYRCSFPTIWAWARYDSALATAVNNNSITIWKPNTSYSVWQYIQSWQTTTVARCITAHTSWSEYDSTKFEAVYWDVYISWILRDCNITVAWTTIISGLAQYATAYTLPSLYQSETNLSIIVEPQSSSITNNNIVICWYRWLSNSTIKEWFGHEWWFKILMIWECSSFDNNRIISHTWSLYSSWYSNMITNNIWTYVSWQTTPTITQQSWGNSVIDNNIFYAVAEWD